MNQFLGLKCEVVEQSGEQGPAAQLQLRGKGRSVAEGRDKEETCREGEE